MSVPPHQVGARVWYGSELQTSNDWIEEFAREQIEELEAAARIHEEKQTPISTLVAADFSLPSLSRWVARTTQILNHGRGFVLVRGLPTSQWGLSVSQYAYAGLGLQLGQLGVQNAAGDVVGHIRATGEDPNDPSIRRYKTTLEQPFHTDGGDVIALLCLQAAKEGGQSRLCSSQTVYNEIRKQRPDLVHLLFEPFYFDRNDEQRPGEPPAAPLPLCRTQDNNVRTFYVGWYIRDAQRHPDVPRLTDEQNQLLELIDRIALDPHVYVSMDFQPGDIQLIKNCYTLHARTAYQDTPDRPRHLLRLWINVKEGDAMLPNRPLVEGASSDSSFIKET